MKFATATLFAVAALAATADAACNPGCSGLLNACYTFADGADACATPCGALEQAKCVTSAKASVKKEGGSCECAKIALAGDIVDALGDFAGSIGAKITSVVNFEAKASADASIDIDFGTLLKIDASAGANGEVDAGKFTFKAGAEGDLQGGIGVLADVKAKFDEIKVDAKAAVLAVAEGAQATVAKIQVAANNKIDVLVQAAKDTKAAAIAALKDLSLAAGATISLQGEGSVSLGSILSADASANIEVGGGVNLDGVFDKIQLTIKGAAAEVQANIRNTVQVAKDKVLKLKDGIKTAAADAKLAIKGKIDLIGEKFDAAKIDLDLSSSGELAIGSQGAGTLFKNFLGCPAGAKIVYSIDGAFSASPKEGIIMKFDAAGSKFAEFGCTITLKDSAGATIDLAIKKPAARRLLAESSTAECKEVDGKCELTYNYDPADSKASASGASAVAAPVALVAALVATLFAVRL